MKSSFTAAGIASEYLIWLKDNTFTEDIGDGIARISFPFLNHNRDYTEIYVIHDGDDSFVLTDDGETMSGLELSGLNLSQKRKEMLRNIVSSYGVSIDDANAIFVKAQRNDLFFKKHMLVDCLSKVQDMIFLKETNVKSFFLEDVASYLEDNDVRFTKDITLHGVSKLPIHFDFIIPRSKSAPERLIKASNVLDIDVGKILVFNWQDTKPARSESSVLYAFVNDAVKTIPQKSLEMMAQYGIKTVPWSSRDSVLSELVA